MDLASGVLADMDDAITSEPTRVVRAARGTELSCKGWQQEAALRMLMNNLDPEVAEHPEDLVVYGGTGRAARSWAAFDAIVASLRELENDETLLVQSGKPVGVFRTHEWSPRVLIANSNLVGDWANWEKFRELEALGLRVRPRLYLSTEWGVVTGTIAMSGTGAKVALVSSTTRLSCAGAACATDAAVVDLVGWGPTASACAPTIRWSRRRRTPRIRAARPR